jgi:hypothetical protein
LKISKLKLTFWQLKSRIKMMEINSELMQCIPHKNVAWEVDPDKNQVVLLKPKSRWHFLDRYFRPKINKPYYRINLDLVGTNVWQHIDGKKTVKEIGVLLKNDLGSGVEPVYERLQQFIISLQRNKFILLQKP